MAHHGSLGRAERFDAEQRLKRGELKALVATASLELGIDVGAVDLVCQIDSPKSIAAAIQRIGRSGHALAATPKGRLFALTLDDLIECARGGARDPPRAARRGRDSAGMPRRRGAANRRDRGGGGRDRRSASCSTCCAARTTSPSLTRRKLRRLLEEMAAEVRGASRAPIRRFFTTASARRVRPRRGARLAAITSGGTIPESGNYDVVIESQGRKIGDVEEDFAQESSRGDVFALGSMPWQIQRISRGRLMVEPAPGWRRRCRFGRRRRRAARRRYRPRSASCGTRSRSAADDPHRGRRRGCEASARWRRRRRRRRSHTSGAGWLRWARFPMSIRSSPSDFSTGWAARRS